MAIRLGTYDATDLAALDTRMDAVEAAHPYCEKTKSGGGTQIGTTDSYVSWTDIAEDNTGTAVAPSTAILAATKAGIWQTNAYVLFPGSSTGIRRIFGWEVNNSIYANMADPDDNSGFHLAISFASRLEVGEYHRISVYSTHVASPTTYAVTGRAQSYWVGP